MQDELQTYFSQDVTRHSVLHTKRKATNKVVGFIFVFGFLLWIVVAGYALSLPTRGNTGAFVFRQFDSTRILTICGFILLSAAFTFIAFILLRCVSQITKITLAVVWIPVPCSIVIACYLISSYQQQFALHVVVQVIASILSFILVLVLLSTEWFHMPEKVLKEACKMVASVPSTLVFALFSLLLTTHLSVIFFVVIVKLLASNMTYIGIISMFVNLIFGSWTVVTFATLGLMTLNGTFAEYYWTEHKSRVSFGTVLQLLGINLRYHIGTAAMHYPFLGGLSAVIYLLKQMRSMRFAGASKSVKLFFFYNLFDAILIRIILLGSAATCSIQGKNFYESMTHTMRLYMNNPRRVLVVCKVLEIVLTCMFGLVMFFTSFSAMFYMVMKNPSVSVDDLIDINSWEMKFWILVIVGGVMILLPLLECICAASCSIVLCIQEEVVQLGDELPGDSYVMSRDLHSALKHSGPPECFRGLCSC